MKKNYFPLLIVGLLLLSCNKAQHSDLLIIPVDISQNNPLRLSEIADEIFSVELELTDESLLRSDWPARRVLLSENYIIIVQALEIFVFDKEGRFVRQIGRVGQGPGEFTWLMDITIDESNKHLFITDGRRIIRYHLNGEYIDEIVRPVQASMTEIHYSDGHFLLSAQQFGFSEDRGHFMHSVFYRLDNTFQVVDSFDIRTDYFGWPEGLAIPLSSGSSVVRGLEAVYFYERAIPARLTQPTEIVASNTLYRLENLKRIPELRLSFRNDGIDRAGNRFICIHTIFRSSRYVFSIYDNTLTGNRYQFVFDTKTGRGYNMQDGFIDDINHIDERILIRPRITNSEYFYFWHTHMDPDSFDEPNPTLYVGRLKR